MPTYQYHCPQCGADLEIFQHMTEPSLTVCPDCQGDQLRKVFSAVGVVFKGSGFYATDNRTSGASATTADKRPPESPSAGGQADSKGEAAKPKPTTDKPVSKPAAAKPPAKTPAVAA